MNGCSGYVDIGVDEVAYISYNEFNEARTFTLPADNVVLEFDVPIDTFDIPHIIFSVEFDTGRSIYINSQWVHEGCRDIRLWTDKQVYLPGEEILCTVGADMDGPTSISALDESFTTNLNLVANQDQQFSFTLPEDISSGTKYIDYTFMDEEYSYPFDVDSYKAFFVSIDLDESRYSQVDTIKSDMVLWSKQDFYAYIDGYVENPAGERALAFTYEGELAEGNNWISVKGNLDTAYSGVHYMDYEVYRDIDRSILITKTSRAFDVGNFQVVSVVIDQDEYEYGFDDVEIAVTLWGEAFSGALSLELDGLTIQTQSATFDGYTSVSFEIPYQEVQVLGDHNLVAVLEKDGIISIGDSQFEVVDTIPPEIAVSGIEGGSYYNHDVAPVIFATDLNIAAASIFLNGDAFVNGSLVTLEDEYLLYAVAWDTSGNFSELSTQFTIDKTPPELWTTLPEDEFINYPVEFLTSINEPHRDLESENVSIRFDGELSAETDIGTPVFLEEEGPYEVTVTATDLAGNTASLTKTITLDFTPPVIDVSGFVDGEYRNGDVIMSVTIIDEHRNPVEESLQINNVSYPFDQNLTFTVEDTYFLHAKASDLAGNAANLVSMVFTIDKSLPMIDLLIPAGCFASEQTFIPILNEANLLASWVKVFHDSVVTEYAFGEVILLEMEASYTIHGWAEDLAGNTEEEIVGPVIIDTTAPEIDVGISAGYYNYGLTFIPTVTDANLTSAIVTVLLNGSLTLESDPGTPITLNNEGEYSVIAEGVDCAENQNQEAITNVVIDKTPPEITVTGVEDGAVYTKSVSADVTVTDLHLDSYSIELDGASYTSGDTISDIEDHELIVNAWDLAGNTASALIHFSIEEAGIDIIVTKSVIQTPRVLFWPDCPREDCCNSNKASQINEESAERQTLRCHPPPPPPPPEECPIKDFVEDMMSEAGIYYFTVEDEYDFTEQLRSGLYNVYLLTRVYENTHKPRWYWIDEELVESVNYGNGIVGVVDHYTSLYDLFEVFGASPSYRRYEDTHYISAESLQFIIEGGEWTASDIWLDDASAIAWYGETQNHDGSIILPGPGTVSVAVVSGEAYLESDLYLTKPEENLLFDPALSGDYYELPGEYDTGTELVFAIEVDGTPWNLGIYRHYSDGQYCIVEEIEQGRWLMQFEDTPSCQSDWDYDDIIIEVVWIPSGPESPYYYTDPAATFKQYGRGASSLVGFDVSEAMESDRQLAADFLANIIYSVTPTDVFDPLPLDMVQVGITIQNLGNEVLLDILENIPENLGIDLVDDGEIVPEGIEWFLELEENHIARLNYGIRLPDEAGTWILETEVSYFENGDWILYDMYPLELSLIGDITHDIDYIYALVESIHPDSFWEYYAQYKILKYFKYIKYESGWWTDTRWYAEGKIGLVLKMIEYLKWIDNPITYDIRLGMDRILRYWGARWHLSE